MTNWIMNRMGFVNFWLYDEEVFHFANGRLLLRGSNASGKSITTQSFIPFILDGNRSPERLDPFGSRDRKMDYYLLGNGERDDSTGYLFMEFVNQESGQYKTIGIGLRAQKGKNMSFWGFNIKSGKRIGFDFNLYKEVGKQKIPMTRQELKNVLADGGDIVENQGEYKKMVNDYLFKFPKIEYYEQFVNLLIKVRAPKLSKDVKPTMVYSILNESLQTLSDEDLRAMVDAMEKMDDIEIRLQGMKQAYKDVNSICTEYDKYNKYMFYKKSNNYINSKDEATSYRKKLNGIEKNINEERVNLETENKYFESINMEFMQLKSEKSSLNCVDIETAAQDLETYKQQINKEQVRLKEKEKYLNEQLEKSKKSRREYDEIKNQVEDLKYEIDKKIVEIDDIDEFINFTNHSIYKSDISTNKDINIIEKNFKHDISIYTNTIKDARRALKLLNEIEIKYDEAVEKTACQNAEKEKVIDQLEKSEKIENDVRDKIIEEYYIAKKNNNEFIMDDDMLGNIVKMISEYKGSSDALKIMEYKNKIYNNYNTKLEQEKHKIKTQLKSLKKERDELEKELSEIKEQGDPTPNRKAKTIEARKALQKLNIPFTPFYELIDFKGDLSESEKSLVEEQLIDMGILDALVVPKDYKDKISDLMKDMSDCFISINTDTPAESINELKLADEGSVFSDEVEHILKHISNNMENSNLAICKNGMWKIGSLVGNSVVTNDARFIGVKARKENKERIIKEIENKIVCKNEEIDEQKTKLEIVQEKINLLKIEFEKLPLLTDLEAAIEIRKELELSYNSVKKKLQELEDEEKEISEKFRICKNEALNKCSNLPFKRTYEEYEEAVNSVIEYTEKFQNIINIVHKISSLESSALSKLETIENIEESIDEISSDISNIRLSISNLNSKIKGLNDYLDSPETKALAQKIKEIEAKIVNLDEEIREYIKKIEKSKNNINHLEEKLTEVRNLYEQASKKENTALKYLEEEISLGLTDNIISENIKKENINNMDIKKYESEKTSSDIIASLNKVFNQHLSSLTQYAPRTEGKFEDGDYDFIRSRQCIIFTWQGKELSPGLFKKELAESIENIEMLIMEKDRELFENILSDTLSKKLYVTIQESRKWVQDMNRLMKNIDTSMDLKFSLSWKGKPIQSENEMNVDELEKMLFKDKKLLTREDIERLSTHFRNKINTGKKLAIENEDIINYTELVRNALDYRQWFEFGLHFQRGDLPKKELTNNEFNKFSGGEKAMAMYVPLFAAISAQYQKSSPDCPRIIALDEAFAGVDEKNISSMFKLVEDLNFCYIMNSQALWGCYETVTELKIAELQRPMNSDVVTVIFYDWNGTERILDDTHI